MGIPYAARQGKRFSVGDQHHIPELDLPHTVLHRFDRFGAFCVLAAMFTPTLFALGMVGLARVDNIIQMVYYLRFPPPTITASSAAITHKSTSRDFFGVHRAAEIAASVKNHTDCIST